MRKGFVITLILFLINLSFLVCNVGPATAETIIVPDDYLTIQEAIDYAGVGGTIFVRSGTYMENVTVNKTVSLVGENKHTTIIDGRNYTTPITILASGVHLSGFTIQNSSKLDPYRYEGTDGLYMEASNCTISNNIFSNNARGIRIWRSNHNIFVDNVIVNSLEAGFLVAGYCGENILQCNNLANNGLGIVLYRNGNRTILRNNTMTNNTYNFKIDPVQHYDVFSPKPHDIDESNTVDGKPIYYWVNKSDKTVPSDAGYIAIINSKNITVQNLTLMNNGAGIFLYNSHNCTIKKVQVFNSQRGIKLYKSTGCIVELSTVLNCSQIGFLLYDSQRNHLFHNNVINCSHSARISRPLWSVYPNAWDNGFSGNYWSDYNGSDPEEDGIGNTPYTIDEGNIDNFPSMYPYLNHHWNPADLNYDFRVDIYDVVLICGTYLSTPSNANWNPHCDITGPYGVIDIFDIVMFCSSYGEEY